MVSTDWSALHSLRHFPPIGRLVVIYMTKLFRSSSTLSTRMSIRPILSLILK
jgi:hypothetical protein